MRNFNSYMTILLSVADSILKKHKTLEFKRIMISKYQKDYEGYLYFLFNNETITFKIDFIENGEKISINGSQTKTFSELFNMSNFSEVITLLTGEVQ